MEFKLKNSVENKIAFGVVAAVLVLVSVGWLSYSTINRLVATDKWVAHTQEVIATLESGLAILTDAETKQRGYLLTGDDQFLKECRSAQGQVAGWLSQVRQLTADNPETQQRLDRLEPLIAQRMARLDQRIETRQKLGFQAAVADMATTRQGPGLMDQIWSSVGEIREAENQLLVKRENAAQRSANTCQLIVLGASTLASVIGITAFFSTRRDLVLRTQVQQELKASQALMQSILDNTPALVFVKDLAGRYLFVNRRFTEIAGRPSGEILGKTVFDISPKVLAQTADEHFRAIVKTGRPVEIEETVQYSDGPRPHLAVRFPVRDAAGNICALAGISTDITERKQIERMRLQFQTLFESAPGLFVVLKPDFTIVAVSDAYLKATMTQREAIIGRGLFEVFPDNPDTPGADGVSNLRASLNRVLQNGVSDTMAIQKYDVRRPDGVFEERFWSPVNSPIIGPDNHVDYIIHRAEDVTDFVRRKSPAAGSENADMVKRLEQMEAEIFRSSQKISAANEQLRLANHELESFSYSVSHDLRAPLRHIDGFVDLLRKHALEKLNERERRYLDVIAGSARQMGVLIDDLLVFSRMSRTEMHWAKVAPNALLEEALNGARIEANGRQIAWKIGTLPDVQADPAMLRQVWVNLLNNAVKYTRTRSPAEIEVGCNDGPNDDLVFFVRDNGVGFEMEYVHKLFGVFQRLHRADEFEGTGIGLANVRRIITRHGGRTWAEGRPGAGATFYFSLPKPAKQTKG